MKKSLGQNFLKDQNILNNIIKQVPPNLPIIEIGTGGGALTEKLAQSVTFPIISYEIDSEWFELTKTRLSNYSNLTFINEDILTAEINLTANFAVVANIPYYITSPIIEMFLTNQYVKEINIMVQKEIAQRIIAKPGEKDYSSLSIFCQTRANITKLFDVSKHCFFPAPKVDSSFIKLTPVKLYLNKITNIDLYNNIIRSAFWGKRKTIQSCLTRSPYLNLDKAQIPIILEKCKINLKERGEIMNIEQFIEIANNLDKKTVSC